MTANPTQTATLAALLIREPPRVGRRAGEGGRRTGAEFSPSAIPLPPYHVSRIHPHRASISASRTPTATVANNSAFRTPTSRPRAAPTTPQGMSASQNTASSVPTQLARSEFHTSPWTSREKLVVIPHDGHGFPVIATMVHSGSPSWVWVAIVRGFPAASYGRIQAAAVKTA